MRHLKRRGSLEAAAAQGLDVWRGPQIFQISAWLPDGTYFRNEARDCRCLIVYCQATLAAHLGFETRHVGQSCTNQRAAAMQEAVSNCALTAKEWVVKSLALPRLLLQDIKPSESLQHMQIAI